MNVVIICLDTFRADIVGPGQQLSIVDTPNLDSLAEQSVVFTRAFGEGQPTIETRRSFFTGCRSFPWRYNFDRRGVWHHAPGWHKIPPEQDTLAEVLLDRGYYTGLIADTYHMFKPTMNFWRGFASYEFIRGQESDNWRGGNAADIEHLMKRHVRQPIDWRRHATLVQYLFNNCDRQTEDDYLCARVFHSACRWLDDNAVNAPFFLWIDSFDPHEPWDPPRKYADRYCENYDGIDFIFPNNVDPTPEEVERTKALYFGEATFVDKWVGMLLDKLESPGLLDETLVIAVSDHGTQLMDQGKFGKGADELHPFNTRILCMMRHPDGPRGQQVDAFVQTHDLMPTVLHLLDVPCDWCDGENAWDLVTGKRASLREQIVTGWCLINTGPAAGRVSVRDEWWNYVVSTHKEGDDELYDLTADPGEHDNIAGQHPDVVAERRRAIEAVVRQPLPMQSIEVCDPSPAPYHRFVKARGGVPGV